MSWIDDNMNSVVQGDCLEILKELPDNSVDLIVTDPPYGISFRSKYRMIKHDAIANDDVFPLASLNECFRVSFCATYVFCRWDQLCIVPKPHSVIAWVKNNWSMGDLKHEHGRQWEACCFYPQDRHQFKKRIPDVIMCDRTGNHLHPTEKPVELMGKIIACNEGDLILDPFCGSGTTLVAAKQLGRRYIGIEIEPKYVKIAMQRLALTGESTKDERIAADLPLDFTDML